MLENTNYQLKLKEQLNLIANQYTILKSLRKTASDSTTCKLCGLRFNRTTEGRNITAHTLLNLRKHLRRRNIDLNINFKVRAEEFLSHTLTVCQVCYSLAIAEHHLMEAEKKLAVVLNIPVKESASLVRDMMNQADDKNIVKPVLEVSKVYMWRVMFYFNYINRNSNSLSHS